MRVTVPVNPPRLVTVIVDMEEEPARIVMVSGLEASWKSTTLTVTYAVCVGPEVPLRPVTVTT